MQINIPGGQTIEASVSPDGLYYYTTQGTFLRAQVVIVSEPEPEPEPEPDPKPKRSKAKSGEPE
ncbi:MAG: hypothetical protein HC890_07860 [Chloroflexaceae bacterium]|nr:hypothetical protein [Chloroflexaceae bacterium]